MATSAGEEPPQISLRDLRDNLKEALRKSGALNSVKAHIRKEFINSLSSQRKPHERKHVDTSLQTRILMSLIYQYFKSIGLTHSLSVFVAECGYESQGFLSEDDLMDVLKLTHSPLSSSRHRVLPNTSLELLVEEHANTPKHQIDASMQTDLSGPGIREVLDSQIKELHLNFLTRRETERVLPNKTIEERMISYQRECEERFKREYESQLNHLRTVEISAVKHDEALKMRLHLEQIRSELEHSYQQRLAVYDEKESQQKQALLDSERRIQQLEYDSRQRIQRELDEIRSREEATRRKNEMELQTTKLLEARLKEMQAVIESREREVGRREKELEIKQNEIHTVAHEEARLSVETQLENLLREKASLMIERKRFEDEKANDASLRLAISEMRSRHREMENEIANKEDEINNLKSMLTRLQNTLAAEDKDVSKLLDSCGWKPSQSGQENESPDIPPLNSLGLGVGGKIDGIVLLIRKNIQLEANVAQLQRDLTSEVESTLMEKRRYEELSQSLELCRKELDDVKATKSELSLQNSRVLTDMGKLKKHIIKLRQNLEESKREKEDLEQLLSEQRNVIEKLRLKFSNRQSYPAELPVPNTNFPLDRHGYTQGTPINIPYGWTTRPINYYGEIQPGFDLNQHYPPLPHHSNQSPDQVVQTPSPPQPQLRVNDSQLYMHPPRESINPPREPGAVIKAHVIAEPPPSATSTSAIVEEDPPIVITKIEFNENEIDRLRQKEEREDRERREKEDLERREKEDREWREKRAKEEQERRDKEEADRREKQRLEEENRLREERDREDRRRREEREANERKEREEQEQREREAKEKRDREERERREELAREAEEERIRLEKEKEEKYRLENAEKLEEERRRREAEEEIERKKEEDAKALQEARAKVLARRQQQQKNQQIDIPEPSRLPSPKKSAGNVPKFEDFDNSSPSVSAPLPPRPTHSPQSDEDDGERSIGMDENSDYSW